MGRKIVRYSEAFKREVVEEMERGRFQDVTEAARCYGIGARETIQRWMKQYGKGHLLPRVVRVERMNERDEIKQLKKRNKQLEKALAEAKVHEVLNQAYFEMVCEKFGIEDVEAFKKKVDGKLFGEAEG